LFALVVLMAFTGAGFALSHGGTPQGRAAVATPVMASEEVAVETVDIIDTITPHLETVEQPA
jgi:hypothetical protein